MMIPHPDITCLLLLEVQGHMLLELQTLGIEGARASICSLFYASHDLLEQCILEIFTADKFMLYFVGTCTHKGRQKAAHAKLLHTQVAYTNHHIRDLYVVHIIKVAID